MINPEQWRHIGKWVESLGYDEVKKRLNGSDASTCSVRYRLEGQLSNPPHQWNPIEIRDSLDAAKRDEADYRSWMDESGWRDFRIVKVTITEKTLTPNEERTPTR
mgnify:CR=1 FL=1